MRLRQLIKALDKCMVYPRLCDFEVKGISCDSKDIRNDFVFVAIKGSCVDSHMFIGQAIEKGARAVVIQDENKGIDVIIKNALKAERNISFIIAEDTRKALAKLAARFYGYPALKLKIIGITGTNGKTTVSYLIERLLKEVGMKPAVLGTINYRFKNQVIPAQNTTPGPLKLQGMLAQMKRCGTDYLAMEVSSHALDQGRTEGIRFGSAIFTNLTQDHLDYHRTMESYFQVKSKLFKGLLPGSFCVINNDDAYGRRLKNLVKVKKITYAIDRPADVIARDIKYTPINTEFILKAKNMSIKVKTRLIGRHNVYNILASVAWAMGEGLSIKKIISAIPRFISPPGRLENINTGKGFLVFVDYAHTPDALENVIRTLRQLAKGRIIVVFGCGGQRDKGKRPKMGRIVTRLADYAIITNDNPRSESPHEIIGDIKKGIIKKNYSVIPERLKAIRKSLSLASPGDIVLIAGKGHEDYQILRNKKLHFDDREVVRECLA